MPLFCAESSTILPPHSPIPLSHSPTLDPCMQSAKCLVINCQDCPLRLCSVRSSTDHLLALQTFQGPGRAACSFLHSSPMTESSCRTCHLSLCGNKEKSVLTRFVAKTGMNFDLCLTFNLTSVHSLFSKISNFPKLFLRLGCEVMNLKASSSFALILSRSWMRFSILFVFMMQAEKL